MAKLSVVRREAKRSAVRSKHYARRTLLKELIRHTRLTTEKQMLHQQLYKLPRDSSVVRKRNRCAITGRSRGTYRLFGLTRMVIRELVARGELPGVTKSSW